MIFISFLLLQFAIIPVQLAETKSDKKKENSNWKNLVSSDRTVAVGVGLIIRKEEAVSKGIYLPGRR